MKSYTLITGASSGIGFEMARRCAELGRNVLLVALPGEGLKEKACELAEEHGVKAEAFECNLTEEGAVESIYSWVEDGGFEVDFLVNNAGFGGTAPFCSHTQGYISSMISLNVMASTLLTNKFLPMLKKNKPSRVLNVASLIAGQSAPYKSLYSATKTYVKNLSVSLSYELESEGVSVSVLLPGATPTNEVVKEQISSGAFVAKVSVKSPRDVGRIAIDKALSGKRVITTGRRNGVIRRALAMLPSSIVASLALYQSKKMNL